MQIDPARRLAVLLAPVFALRHPRDYGVGDTQAVREAIDFCVEMGFAILQLLPIHELVGEYSPYSPISACALSPLFLTLSEEEVPGWIEDQTLEKTAPQAWVGQLREGLVKYNSVQPLKIHVLLASHRRFLAQPMSELREEFTRFKKENGAWLEPYTLFRLLIWEYEGNSDWTEWRPEHRTRAAAEDWLAQAPHRNVLEQARDGFAYIQWVAARQWRAVRAYADQRGIALMGELSFGVSRASVDTWERPDLFDMDWSMGAETLCAFDVSHDSERWGQNWGFPPYRWENHRSEGFAWMRRRLEMESRLFHLCRIDHLRGYFRAYMLPWMGGAQHTQFSRLGLEEIKAQTGGRMPRYVPGPDSDPALARMNALQGRELIAVLQQAAGSMGLVAELMADMTPYMRAAVEDLKLANLSFPTIDRTEDNTLIPIDSLRPLSMATYATHDQAPLAAQYANLVARAQTGERDGRKELDDFLKIIGWQGPHPEMLDDALLEASQRTLLQTPCCLASFLTSDMLGIPQRFNLPGSYGVGTWAERVSPSLHDCLRHPVYGPRLATLRRLIQESGRRPMGSV